MVGADRLMELEAKAAKKKTQGGIQGPVEASAAISHIHMEYSVLPGDTPLKTDVVFYVSAARIFPDKHDPKTVRTWWTDGNLWCSWTHSHCVLVTDQLLREFANHTVEIKIWDSKEKMSQKARLDRPKAFKTSELEGHPPTAGIRSMTSMLGIAGGIVITQAKLFNRDQPKQLLAANPFTPTIKKHITVVKQKKQSAVKNEETFSPTPDAKKSEIQGARVVPEPGNQLRDYSQLANIAHTSTDMDEMMRKKRLNVAYRHGHTAHMKTLHPGAFTKKEEDGGKTAPTMSFQKKLKYSPNVAGDSSNESGDLKQVLEHRSSTNSISAFSSGPAAGAVALLSPSGIVQSVQLRVAALYDNRKSTSCRLFHPQGLVSDFLMTLIVDPSLMSEQQLVKFRPVVLKVISARPLPQGFSPENVFCRCLVPDLSPNPQEINLSDEEEKPLKHGMVEDAQYKERVARRKEAEAHLISQSEPSRVMPSGTVFWNHYLALLTGDIPEEALRQNLLRKPLLVELHDREPVENQNSATASTTSLNSNLGSKMRPAVFGSLPNDNQLASSAVLPPPPPEPLKPPHGLAELTLNEMVLSHNGKGIRFSETSATVRPIQNLQTIESNEVKRPSAPRYLEVGTTIKVQTRIPIPLFMEVHTVEPEPKPVITPKAPKLSRSRNSSGASKKSATTPSPPPPSEPVLQSNECIGVLVIILPRNGLNDEKFSNLDSSILHFIQSEVIEINSESLALTALLAPEERANALAAYQLSEQQQTDRSLQLVTGFHLLDDEGALFVVEASPPIVKEIWEALFHQVRDQSENKASLFFNSGLSSPIRRYGGLDLSYTTIAIGRGISKIAAEPLLYVRDMAPTNCRKAAVKLNDLRKYASSLSDVLRQDLLPTTLELHSLMEEFSFKTPPFEGIRHERDRELTLLTNETDYDHENEITEQIIPVESHQDQKNRDFLRENIDSVWKDSEINRLKREQDDTLCVAVNTGHVYSTHRINAVELAKQHIVEQMLLPSRRYTFCQGYHHRTLTPRSAPPETFNLYPHGKNWQFPGAKTSIQANQPNKVPDTARLDELRHPWRENWLHEKYLQPPLPERDYLPWKQRSQDFQLLRRPDIEKIPASVFKGGDATEYTLDCLPPKPECRFQTYRRGIKSEIADFTFHESLLQRVDDILHEPPQKLSLRFKSVRTLPKISITVDPSKVNDQKCQPYGPAEYNDWLLDRNIVTLNSM